MRLSNEADLIEDMYLAVRELLEVFGVPPRTMRRYLNQALKGTPPGSIRDRVWTEEEKVAGSSLPEEGRRISEARLASVGTAEDRPRTAPEGPPRGTAP